MKEAEWKGSLNEICWWGFIEKDKTRQRLQSIVKKKNKNKNKNNNNKKLEKRKNSQAQKQQQQTIWKWRPFLSSQSTNALKEVQLLDNNNNNS